MLCSKCSYPQSHLPSPMFAFKLSFLKIALSAATWLFIFIIIITIVWMSSEIVSATVAPHMCTMLSSTTDFKTFALTFFTPLRSPNYVTEFNFSFVFLLVNLFAAIHF